MTDTMNNSSRVLLDRILETRLVPVAVISDSSHAVPLADALMAAGITVIEVTLRTPAALEAIRLIRKSCPNVLVGAGTVLDPKIVAELADLGSSFVITPGFNPRVVESALEHALPVIPGVLTPSEIEQARNFGLTTLKFFPAEAAGGTAMLRAFAGPYQHTGIRFIPTGGINLRNLTDYLEIPCVAAVGGSWFVAGNLIDRGAYDEITELSREALRSINTIR